MHRIVTDGKTRTVTTESRAWHEYVMLFTNLGDAARFDGAHELECAGLEGAAYWRKLTEIRRAELES